MASSPGRTADLLASILATTPHSQLAVLDAVDVNDRLTVALSLVKVCLITHFMPHNPLQTSDTT